MESIYDSMISQYNVVFKIITKDFTQLIRLILGKCQLDDQLLNFMKFTKIEELLWLSLTLRKLSVIIIKAFS